MINLEKIKIPKSPGVYLFKDCSGAVLYIGKAANLSARVRSYFAGTEKLKAERGAHIVDMVDKSCDIEFKTTNTALEAVVLEANLIKKFQPPYNTKEKSNKSFNFVVITNDEFPKVKVLRGKDISNTKDESIKYVFGPFPESNIIKKSLRIIRKIFPYSDNCAPGQGKPCFYNQIGLCPGVCVSGIDKSEYLKNILNIKLFFEGKKENVINNLKKQMLKYAKNQEFEKSAKLRDQIFALEKIEEASLIEEMYKIGKSVIDMELEKIEGYDISHIQGQYRIGAIVAYKDGKFIKKDYRWMYIKTKDKSDQGAIKELIKRRFRHKDWEYPKLIVIDGGKTQLKAAISALNELSINGIDVVSVVKDRNHKPKDILGSNILKNIQKNTIKKINEESHRFALSIHKKLRDKIK